ncbi:MAG: flagellar hook-length control protein FliK [Pseudomonadota bacterium]
MRIPSTRLLLPLPASASREQLLQNLKPGQILQATALSENTRGNIKLQIGVTRLIAQTQLAVKPGQPLTLLVDKTGDPPELKLLQLPSLKQHQANALKHILPRQQPLPPLFERLTALTGMPQEKGLSDPVRQAANTLLERVLPLDHPQFKQQLGAALLNSGLLTEARLLHGTLDRGDFKLNLLRLLGLVQSLLPQQSATKNASQPRDAQTSNSASQTSDPGLKLLIGLLKQLDGAIARMQTNQLLSLPQEDPSRQTWQFELPIRQGDQVDLLRILVEKDSSCSAKKETPSWSLTLRMNLRELGAMRVQLRLWGETISSVFWAQELSTNQLIQTNLTTLREAFEKTGLKVKKLETFHTKLAEEECLPRVFSLLSEKV